MSDNSFPTYSLFGNNFGYLGRPLSRDYRSADAVVLGIPYDLGTSGRSGSRFGPQGIRSASSNLRWEEMRWPWRFNAFDRLNVIDYGDIEFTPGESQTMVDAVVETASEIIAAGKTLLSFGGDHFVTLPLLRAHAKHHGKMALIHFDAHTDTEKSTPSRYYHGSMFHHAPNEGLIDPSRSVQVGIRTEYGYDDHPFTVLDARWANEQSVEQVVERIKQVVGEGPAYLTFDIDCIDPAFAPGTGTPVIGGLSSDRALAIVRGLKDLDIVGMDVVEVAPCYDHAEVTSLAGATLGLEMLYLVASRRG
ncbi:agmatinase [Aestuariirhabdus litorea]|uniref:Agmatinase n=1 Tax=Aestuariirhabdus litorea TaxID=2528527 RepID=A0A3P3VMI2_9GAMM|nr:agmatinase [Aestuariirhabdus litorea]RRJ83830.1 agmatinase [Aestuariirhabdus litorea]RWW97053.1 agmatinase [Endozoicomonadaceae bacterium GTF-13]